MAVGETDAQAHIRAVLSAQGYRLWRNNVGQMLDREGRPVRYGLANDTSALNAKLKSSDLIGWRPTLVTPDMVGEHLAVFVSIEVKREGWSFPAETNRSEYARCDAQRRWLRMVTREGGVGGFMISPERGYEPHG